MKAPEKKQFHARAAALFILSVALAQALWLNVSARAQSLEGGAPQQSTPEAPKVQPQQGADSTPEIKTRDAVAPFEVRVNMVPLRVVVRDSQGRPVPNLRKEDFQLLEDGKAQTVSYFSADIQRAPSAGEAKTELSGAEKGNAPPHFQAPSRFIALLFDDVHIQFGDLVQARNAAARFIDASLQPSDRAAVFTISGQTQTDFTDDRAALRYSLLKLQPRYVSTGNADTAGGCPEMDYYEADLIENQEDQQTQTVATRDALVCGFSGDSRQITAAAALAKATAMHVLQAGDTQTEYSLRRLWEVLRRVSVLSGQRMVLLISPGFLTPRFGSEVSEIMDRAVRSNVVISTLDSKGLFTIEASPDLSYYGTGDVAYSSIHAANNLASLTRQADVLSEIAYGTGGYFYHGSNDLDAGFRAVGAPAGISYLLGFTPANLKFDGKFHSLKVNVLTKERYVVEARRGFYAPKHSQTPAEAAKQEIEEAVLSQDEQRGLPIELHTQFYKVNSTDAKLAVLAHVDIGHMRFEKAEGRNRNELTVVAALFDRNGNYLMGSQKVLEMRLLDTTLDRLGHTGVNVKSSFDVKPGAYVVRLVVRESNAALLSSQNGVVEIPY